MAEPGDLESLVANNIAMALETESLDLDPITARRGALHMLEDPGKGFYLVAEDGGEIIGQLMITMEWSDWNDTDHWWLQSLYVLPERRGEGVFSALRSELMRRASSAGVRSIRLYVDRDNHTAMAAYRAVGFDRSHYQMWEMSL